MGLKVEDIVYENGKLLVECLHGEEEATVYFGIDIAKGSTVQEVRKKIYNLIAMIMEKEDE